MAQTELIEIDELVDEIVARLLALPNLKAENVRNVRREFSKRLANTSPQIVIALSLRLLQLGRPGFEYRFVAYELVCHHKAALRSLGEKDLAFQWLERAFEEKSEMIPWLNVGADCDNLRSDPRFHNLLRRCGLETERVRAVRN